MSDRTRPKNWIPAADPTVWAPFVVVARERRKLYPAERFATLRHDRADARGCRRLSGEIDIDRPLPKRASR